MAIHEKYTLPSEIESELAELPVQTAACYLERLQGVPIEVVVIARRQAADRMLRDQIDSILVDLVTPRIRAAVRRYGYPPSGEVRDTEDEAMLLFWEKVQHESFFEVRFNRAMKNLAQQAGRNIRGAKQRAFERAALRIDSGNLEDATGRDVPREIADDSDDYSQSEIRLLVQEGLATLPIEQARALTLHYLMGLQIFSHDSTIQTVATELGCGERKARKLIADGKAALGLLIGQEDNDDYEQSGPRGA